MASPKIRIFNHTKGLTGHWWAELDDGGGSVTRASFGPKDITDLRGALGALGFPVDTSDGEFRSGSPKMAPFNRTSDANMDRPRNQVTIPIDRDGYERAMDRINAWQVAAEKPGGIDYRAMGAHPNNCIDPTQDLVTAAGVPGHIADYFSTDALRGSAAGRQAMRRAGVRVGEQGAASDFPDMAFPWMPTPSNRPPVSVPPVQEQASSSPDHSFSSAPPLDVDAPRFDAGNVPNLLNSNSLPANLLNMSPEELRWAKYRY